MVASHDGCQLLQHGNPLQSVRSPDRMLLNPGKFFRCQPGRLLKNIIRNSDFTNIMKQASHTDSLYKFLRFPKRSGQLLCIVGHPVGMAPGINIFCIYHQTQHLYCLHIAFFQPAVCLPDLAAVQFQKNMQDRIMEG